MASQGSLLRDCRSPNPFAAQRRPAVHGPWLRVRSSRSSLLVAASQQQDAGVFDSVKRIAKKIQGALPIVGLISRLATPEGGFDEQSYAEFSRALYQKQEPGFVQALQALEQRHGQLARTRWLFLMMWMAKLGTGIVPSKDMLNAAKRLRVTQDVEIELDRFEGGRQVVRQKYSMVALPVGPLEDQLALAVDTCGQLSLGLGVGEPVAAADVEDLAAVLAVVWPEASREQLLAAIAGREGRSGNYS